MFGCHPAVKSRNTMMPCEWWSMYGTDCEVLQRLAVRVLAQTVSSSPCERNWSTFSLIHTNKRNRIGYERLQKLVYCHYNMKLRERLLRSERRRKAQEDPLDLMTEGQHAYAEDAEDDVVYQWVRSDDLDTSDGRPEPHIAAEAETQGINVDKHVEQQRSPDEAFDPLTRSPEGSPRQSLSRGTRGGETLSDTETESESDVGNESGDDDGGDKGDDDSNDSKDDDDENDDGDGDGGDGGGNQDKRPLSPFTGEENFDRSTQDPDHSSRPGEP
ncbi:nonsense-mediated mRNA decay protein 2-like [Magnolia sinica]|uniref:nonsense-mediated mRNA decay protein 2-like n=1 Tax=Magnolia sinica TaxID=86752 RepID=UPI00265AA14D|nr:nonsense-mediated mRNA decay protein 2-like [Magnolia sinica]